SSSFFRPEGKEAARKKLQITGSPVYLWAGRLEKNKDPMTVVTAFVRFQSLHPEARLYMIFQSEELLEEVKDVITTYHAEDCIRLIGKMEHQQMQTWFSSADFVVSGSHYEGGGIAIAEAMACGAIPLVTNI